MRTRRAGVFGFAGWDYGRAGRGPARLAFIGRARILSCAGRDIGPGICQRNFVDMGRRPPGPARRTVAGPQK